MSKIISTGSTFRIYGDDLVIIGIKKTRIELYGVHILSQYFVYDKTTKIVYVVQSPDRYSGITPYYVLDENGKPEIAVYGENYNG